MTALKYSRQRESIKDYLMHTNAHPTADMVYLHVKEQFPNISLGTVYRNLNLLVDEGAAVRMAFPVERYDANVEPHPHFRCEVCGGVFDLDLPYDKGLDEKALLASGHDIRSHELIFHGVCVNCKPKH